MITNRRVRLCGVLAALVMLACTPVRRVGVPMKVAVAPAWVQDTQDPGHVSDYQTASGSGETSGGSGRGGEAVAELAVGLFEALLHSLF